jgi:predicted transcriptional regulator
MVAALVGTLLAAGTVTAFGLTQRTSDEDRIPMPGPGAWASYEATAVGGDDDVRVAGVVLRWGDETTALDDAFAPHEVWPLDIEIESGDGSQHRIWSYYDARTGAPILDGQRTDRSWQGGVDVGMGGVSLARVTTSELAFDLYHEVRGPCGVLGAAAVRLAPETPTFDGHCARLGGAQPATTFRRVGPLAYENPDDPRFQVAYEVGNPFPTILTLPLSDMVLRVAHTDAVWVLTLTEWQGALPYAPRADASAALDAGPGPVQLLPRTPTMLDDRGVDHPFPLRDAHGAALADTTAPRVAEFVASHPDAYLAQAWSNRERDASGNFHYNWWLTWSDGDAWVAKHVVLRPAGLLGLSAAQLPRQVMVNAYEPADRVAGVPLPQPAAVPQAFPDPAAILVRFAALEPEAAVLNRYGFGVYCGATCDAATALVAGGTFTYDQQGGANDVLMATGTPSSAYSQLMVLGDGRAIYTERALYRTSSALGPSDFEATPAGNAATWQAPSAAVVAGAGLAGLLAGLAVYAAPAAKLPIAALFTRLRGDQLLRHPARARIHSAVEADPGIHFQELARRLDLGKGTLEHHLHKLVEGGQLVAHVSPGYTCYFPRKTDRAVMAAAPFLRTPGPRSILEAIVHDGRTQVPDLCAQTGLSRSTVNHHLLRMKDAGLIEGGGAGGYRPTRHAMKAV